MKHTGHMRTSRTKNIVERRYLTRSEVARLFEVSPATVARWTREGRLACVLTLGGQRRYFRDEITALLLRATRTSGEAPRPRGQA